MANDSKSPTDFFKESKNRKGFSLNYHELTMYYVGYGDITIVKLGLEDTMEIMIDPY